MINLLLFLLIVSKSRLNPTWLWLSAKLYDGSCRCWGLLKLIRDDAMLEYMFYFFDDSNGLLPLVVYDPFLLRFGLLLHFYLPEIVAVVKLWFFNLLPVSTYILLTLLTTLIVLLPLSDEALSSHSFSQLNYYIYFIFVTSFLSKSLT